MDPANVVSPVGGDELLESRGVPVMVGGWKVLQRNFKVLTQRRVGLKTEAGGKENNGLKMNT